MFTIPRVNVISSDEGFEVEVVVEAMWSGTPVVAFQNGGIADILRDASTGWPVPEADNGALADALQAVLRGPTEARRRAHAARVDVAARFAPQRIAELFENAYEQAARRASVRHGRAAAPTELAYAS